MSATSHKPLSLGDAVTWQGVAGRITGALANDRWFVHLADGRVEEVAGTELERLEPATIEKAKKILSQSDGSLYKSFVDRQLNDKGLPEMLIKPLAAAARQVIADQTRIPIDALAAIVIVGRSDSSGMVTLSASSTMSLPALRAALRKVLAGVEGVE